MKKYQVKDGERIIEFTGVRLARSSSFAKGKRRWITLELYRSRAGMYILCGCGHTTFAGEVDRHWVQQANEPAGVIERLYLYNDDDQKYLPHTARRLLSDAGAQDENVRKAYMTEQVA